MERKAESWIDLATSAPSGHSLPRHWNLMYRYAFLPLLDSIRLFYRLKTYLVAFTPARYSLPSLPSQNCTTAHFPLHAHFLHCGSPPYSPLSLSSTPCGSPTTTSALQVRSARVRKLDAKGPMAVWKGVVGSHTASPVSLR